MDERQRDEVRRVLGEVAGQFGGTVHEYPRPGPLVRRIVLLERSDDKGTQFEAAGLAADGTLWVTGHDQGARVSNFFGEGITSYEWVYRVAPDRVPNLLAALGGSPGEDVLARLAEYHTRSRGVISGLLRGPQVGAEFSNWHS